LEEAVGSKTSNGGKELVSYGREEGVKMTERSKWVQLIAAVWKNNLDPSSG